MYTAIITFTLLYSLFRGNHNSGWWWSVGIGLSCEGGSVQGCEFFLCSSILSVSGQFCVFFLLFPFPLDVPFTVLVLFLFFHHPKFMYYLFFQLFFMQTHPNTLSPSSVLVALSHTPQPVLVLFQCCQLGVLSVVDLVCQEWHCISSSMDLFVWKDSGLIVLCWIYWRVAALSWIYWKVAFLSGNLVSLNTRKCHYWKKVDCWTGVFFCISIWYGVEASWYILCGLVWFSIFFIRVCYGNKSQCTQS